MADVGMVGQQAPAVQAALFRPVATGTPNAAPTVTIMDRRVGGVLLILLAVLAVAMLPGIIGRQQAGRPMVGVVPGPPLVGDCLTMPEADGWMQVQRPGYAAQSISPCTGTRYGEVVAIVTDRRPTQPAEPTIGTPSDGSALTDDPDYGACSDAVWNYLGIGLTDGTPVLSTYWTPLNFVGVAPAGPTLLQHAFGQRWVACVLFLNDLDGHSVAYRGSARSGFASSTLPAAFALCLDSTVLSDAQPVACERPHRAELFGAAETARPGLTQALLDTSCRQLVHRLTGMPDPTAAGGLLVTALAQHGDLDTRVSGLGGPTDESGQAYCLALAPASRTIARSLLGLGSSAVPWAG